MYHILVITKDKKDYGEWNIKKTEKEILEEFITPYLKEEEFFLGTGFVAKKDIDRIIVKETKIEIEFIRNYLQSKLPRNVIKVYSIKDAILSSESGSNIVSNLIKKVKLNKKEINTSNINKNNKVFIVHGHNSEMKEVVARYIEKLGLEAIILHEQANLGLTIIEKIEQNTDVGFGIVLYSACDLGKSKKEMELKARARQNVIFEHGFLIGKLGRENVIALNEDEVELPSDISGIVYIPYNGEWKLSVYKELLTRGYNVDIKNI